MDICKKLFDIVDGREVFEYSIFADDGTGLRAITLGATLTSIVAKDKYGALRDVVLGYDSAGEYRDCSTYFGATCGRCANRIANASFALGGRVFCLDKNNGNNHLHGGFCGFNKKLFGATVEDDSVVMTYTSPDAEEGYPGELFLKVIYGFCDGAVTVNFEYTASKDTVANIVNHSYFNLNGHGSKHSIEDHYLTIDADEFCAVDEGLIPFEDTVSVVGTPFDFTKEKKIGAEINTCDLQLKRGGGYDHNFCLRDGDSFARAARLCSKESGICMEVWTDRPGMQVYTGNFIGDEAGKGGARYFDRCGVALETQLYPNAINTPSFESPVVRDGQTLRVKTEYRFCSL
ncbi:MAG: aldose epimerase family protein [Oscillospiraceae bacterium]